MPYLERCHKFGLLGQQKRRENAAALMALRLLHDSLPLSARLREQLVQRNTRNRPQLNILRPPAGVSSSLYYLLYAGFIRPSL